MRLPRTHGKFSVIPIDTEDIRPGQVSQQSESIHCQATPQEGEHGSVRP